MFPRSFLPFLSVVSLLPFSAELRALDSPKVPQKGDFAHITEPADLIPNELARLDNLINTTQQNLQNQESLRKLIVAYQNIQNQYLQNTEDKESLFHMVKAAHKVLENIKQNHLTQIFDPKFISELTLFSQIANKRGIPREPEINKLNDSAAPKPRG